MNTVVMHQDALTDFLVRPPIEWQLFWSRLRMERGTAAVLGEKVRCREFI